LNEHPEVAWQQKKRTTACLAELKESLDSLITIAQIEFIAQWKHNVVIALSVSDIIEAMESESFLSPAEKDKMLQIVVRQRASSTDTNPRITVKRLRKIPSLNFRQERDVSRFKKSGEGYSPLLRRSV
jgi:hypothetical protein